MNRKQEILDAGVKLYRDQGLLAVTVSAIARAASTSRQTVHQYYDTAESLRERVLTAARENAAQGDEKLATRLALDEAG